MTARPQSTDSGGQPTAIEPFDISWGDYDEPRYCPGCGLEVVFTDAATVLPTRDEVWHTDCWDAEGAAT